MFLVLFLQLFILEILFELHDINAGQREGGQDNADDSADHHIIPGINRHGFLRDVFLLDDFGIGDLKAAGNITHGNFPQLLQNNHSVERILIGNADFNDAAVAHKLDVDIFKQLIVGDRQIKFGDHIVKHVAGFDNLRAVGQKSKAELQVIPGDSVLGVGFGCKDNDFGVGEILGLNVFLVNDITDHAAQEGSKQDNCEILDDKAENRSQVDHQDRRIVR